MEVLTALLPSTPTDVARRSRDEPAAHAKALFGDLFVFVEIGAAVKAGDA